MDRDHLFTCDRAFHSIRLQICTTQLTMRLTGNPSKGHSTEQHFEQLHDALQHRLKVISHLYGKITTATIRFLIVADDKASCSWSCVIPANVAQNVVTLDIKNMAVGIDSIRNLRLHDMQRLTLLNLQSCHAAADGSYHLITKAMQCQHPVALLRVNDIVCSAPANEFVFENFVSVLFSQHAVQLDLSGDESRRLQRFIAFTRWPMLTNINLDCNAADSTFRSLLSMTALQDVTLQTCDVLREDFSQQPCSWRSLAITSVAKSVLSRLPGRDNGTKLILSTIYGDGDAQHSMHDRAGPVQVHLNLAMVPDPKQDFVYLRCIQGHALIAHLLTHVAGQEVAVKLWRVPSLLTDPEVAVSACVSNISTMDTYKPVSGDDVMELGVQVKYFLNRLKRCDHMKHLTLGMFQMSYMHWSLFLAVISGWQQGLTGPMAVELTGRITDDPFLSFTSDLDVLAGEAGVTCNISP